MANICVRYFEITESLIGDRCNVWYVPYAYVTEYQMRSLRKILDETESFRLGATNLTFGKDFEIPLEGAQLSEGTKLRFAECGVVDYQTMEGFINEFRYYARTPEGLNEDWKFYDKIDFTAYILDGDTTPPDEWRLSL